MIIININIHNRIMSNPVNEQDWTPVVFKKRLDKKTEIKVAQRNGQIESIRRFDSNNKQTVNVQSNKIERMVEDSDQKLVLKMIDSKAVDAVKRRRAELKLNQKDLANKAQVPEQIIKSLEQGKEQHNPALLAKLQRVLGIKLLGQNIGELF